MCSVLSAASINLILFHPLRFYHVPFCVPCSQTELLFAGSIFKIYYVLTSSCNRLLCRNTVRAAVLYIIVHHFSCYLVLVYLPIYTNYMTIMMMMTMMMIMMMISERNESNRSMQKSR